MNVVINVVFLAGIPKSIVYVSLRALLNNTHAHIYLYALKYFVWQMVKYVLL